MKTDTVKRVIIKVDSGVQQENVKNTRRGLRTLQPEATDKENLAGRPKILKDLKPGFENETKKQKPLLMHKETQTEKYITNIDDLTGEEAGVDYWKRIAEKRQESLDESFREIEKLKEAIDCIKEENVLCKEMFEKAKQYVEENEKLKNNVSTLQEENKICKEMLEESKHLVEVLQEMISDGENEEAAIPEEEEES